MSKLVKIKKGQKINTKLVVFWSIISAITVALIVSLIVVFVRNYRLKDQDDIEYLTGNAIFQQEESKYYVLIYDFDSTENDIDSFEELVLNYKTFLKKYEGEKVNGEVTALPLFGVDTKLPSNNKMLVNKKDSENISGASMISNSLESDSSKFLRVYDQNLPVLLIIENGVVVDYKQTQNSVIGFLQNIIYSYDK